MGGRVTDDALTSGELFAGVGGLGMAVDAVFGSRAAWFSQYEPPTKKHPKPSQAPSKVLEFRHPGVPNHGDVTAIDWSAVERPNILAGGFPCQDVSLAGRRRGMKNETRSGLWSEFARAIDILRPDWVVIENVRGLLSQGASSDVEPCPWCLGDDPDQHALRALGAVLGDLAELGFDAEWVSLQASDAGAPHGRFRVFILAWPAADARGSTLRELAGGASS
jgi:DNA (cytosine-5)-methyltransferase 1